MKNKTDVKKIQYEKIIKEFNKMDLYYREFPQNFQIQIDTINYWTTSQKWYNTLTKERGVGFNKFKQYLKDNYYI